MSWTFYHSTHSIAYILLSAISMLQPSSLGLLLLLYQFSNFPKPYSATKNKFFKFHLVSINTFSYIPEFELWQITLSFKFILNKFSYLALVFLCHCNTLLKASLVMLNFDKKCI